MLKGHDDHVITCLEFSGSKVVSGSDDNTLKVWSAITGKVLIFAYLHRAVQVRHMRNMRRRRSPARVWNSHVAVLANANRPHGRCVVVPDEGRYSYKRLD